MHSRPKESSSVHHETLNWLTSCSVESRVHSKSERSHLFILFIRGFWSGKEQNLKGGVKVQLQDWLSFLSGAELIFSSSRASSLLSFLFLFSRKFYIERDHRDRKEGRNSIFRDHLDSFISVRFPCFSVQLPSTSLSLLPRSLCPR